MLLVRTLALAGALSVAASPIGMGLVRTCGAQAVSCACRTMGAHCPVCRARRAKGATAVGGSQADEPGSRPACRCGLAEAPDKDARWLTVEPLDPSLQLALAPQASRVAVVSWREPGPPLKRALAVRKRPPRHG